MKPARSAGIGMINDSLLEASITCLQDFDHMETIRPDYSLELGVYISAGGPGPWCSFADLK